MDQPEHIALTLKAEAGRVICLYVPQPGVTLAQLKQHLLQEHVAYILWAGDPQQVLPYQAKHWVGRHVNQAGFYVAAGYCNYEKAEVPMAGYRDVLQSFDSAVALAALAAGYERGVWPAGVVVGNEY
ncbi:hypothetical protein LJ737_04150 [Hymenobacter sp. 15J16-1T3B]|uniref:hypothetical protein n=1 Tax=Hymenobacter sp. 15J16-1T3B TaxID=2886941 RepID=UPI001D12C2CF|nr:hypothetical protein [Hymenobacter sp. 15J16-1T3B]MCC3156414.1 hypothetical protein [Hymenobacter sp. 15J16-1T3B]